MEITSTKAGVFTAADCSVEKLLGPASGLGMAGSWALLWLHTFCEAMAIENVEAQQFGVYMPMFCERLPGGLIDRRPLLRNYMFVRVGEDRIADGSWAKLFNTRGVKTVFTVSSMRPAFIRDADIQQLRQAELARASAATVIADTPWKEGDRAQIFDGSFAGFSAIVDYPIDRDRVYVLLSFMGRQTRVEVSRSHLTPLRGQVR